MNMELAAIMPTPLTGPLPEGISAVVTDLALADDATGQSTGLDPGGGFAAILAPAPAALRHGAGRRAVALRALERQRLLEELMPCGTVLPAQPGTRFRGADAPDLVRANARRLRRIASDIAGAWQYQVVLDWSEAGVLARFKDEPELATLIASGRVRGPDLARAVACLADRLSAEALHRLAGCVREAVALPRPSGCLLNAALLVPTDRMPDLERALEEIDALWTDGFRLRLIGPGPAVSFASLAVEPIGPERIARAAAFFGLDKPPSAEELRRLRRAALLAGTASRQEVDAACDILEACRAAEGASRLFLVERRREGEAARPDLPRVA